MSDFTKAPDGQPTENIELQLRNAKVKVDYWAISLKHDLRDVARSEGMLETWADDVRRLEWQLEQRKATELNGL